MSVLIVDYGMGNLLSVKRAFEECGADVFISDNPKDIVKAKQMVLPGVGTFKDGMDNLNKSGWSKVIRKATLKDKMPLLGICLGMQLLASKGYEGEKTLGLNIISGEVKKLVVTSEDERIPHVGWNEINKVNESILFDGIEDKTDFYFVHSYRFVCNNKSDIITTTPYCGGFVSSITFENIFGVQFHPEKSLPSGFKIIENFLKV